MESDRRRANDRRVSRKSPTPPPGAIPPGQRIPSYSEYLSTAEEKARIAGRVEEWGSAFDPEGPFEEWLVGQIAVDTVCYDQCRVREGALRERSIKRAREDWDSARRYLVELLGERLSRNPSGVTRRLQETVQGADWLLDRWLPLLDRLETDGTWTENEYGLALDMMGIPRELRDEGFPALSPDQRGTLVSVVRGEVERLRRIREEVLVARDVEDRELALKGLILLNEDEVRRVRRDRERCRSRWLWALEKLKRPEVSEASKSSTRSRRSPGAAFDELASETIASLCRDVLDERRESSGGPAGPTIRRTPFPPSKSGS